MADTLLDGRAALITGATSGIGAGIARRFAAAGARVAVSGRDRNRAEALADELGAPIALGDVSVAEEAAAMVETAADKLGGLDIVVNAAGIITRIASVEDVAGAALFLASDLAAHITGVALPVDGGYVAR